MKKTFIIAAAVAATIFTGSTAFAGDYHHKRIPHAYHAPYWYGPVYHFFHRGHYRAHRHHYRGYRKWHRAHRRWHRFNRRHHHRFHGHGPRRDHGRQDRRRRGRDRG